MILFKPEHVEPILAGRKTQTRRLGKKRWNVGAVHQAKTTLFGESFARLRILDVRRQWLSEMHVSDAQAEGYDSVFEFSVAFASINRMLVYEAQLMRVWAVEFEVAP